MRVDLPYDPELGNIVFRRDADGAHFNIPQRVVEHSPTGMEWGYHGSGPADFALNILDLFLPGRDIQCWGGQWVSAEAYNLHQKFKRQFIATAPHAGGTLSAETIRAWIAYQRGELTYDDITQTGG